MNIVRVNQKNQINIPREVAEAVDFGPERYVQVIVRPDNTIQLVPITPEPIYSQKALEGLDRFVEREKGDAKKISGGKEIRRIFKGS